VHERTSGETIRDTYGDYVTDESGNVTYFEPGVVATFDPKAIERDLKLWAEFSDSDVASWIAPSAFSRTPKSKRHSSYQARQFPVSKSATRRRD